MEKIASGEIHWTDHDRDHIDGCERGCGYVAGRSAAADHRHHRIVARDGGAGPGRSAIPHEEVDVAM